MSGGGKRYCGEMWKHYVEDMISDVNQGLFEW